VTFLNRVGQVPHKRGRADLLGRRDGIFLGIADGRVLSRRACQSGFLYNCSSDRFILGIHRGAVKAKGVTGAAFTLHGEDGCGPASVPQQRLRLVTEGPGLEHRRCMSPSPL